MLPIASRSEVLQCVEEHRGLGWGHQVCQRAMRGPLGAAPALATLLHCSHGLELGWASLRSPPHLIVWMWGGDGGLDWVVSDVEVFCKTPSPKPRHCVVSRSRQRSAVEGGEWGQRQRLLGAHPPPSDLLFVFKHVP